MAKTGGRGKGGCFRHRRFSIYPLTTPEGVLAGVLSRENLFEFIKRGDVDDTTTLDQIEMMQLPACETSATVREALERMIHQGRHKCLVTDGQNHLKGIITVMDFLGEAAEGEGLASPAIKKEELAPDPGRS